MSCEMDDSLDAHELCLKRPSAEIEGAYLPRGLTRTVSGHQTTTKPTAFSKNSHSYSSFDSMASFDNSFSSIQSVESERSISSLLSLHGSQSTFAVDDAMDSSRKPRGKRRRTSIRSAEIQEKTMLLDSILWHAQHTPRTVLEDLVDHELQLHMRALEERLNSYTQKTMEESATGEIESLLHSSLLLEDKAAVQNHAAPVLSSPKVVDRRSALLFVDVSGFTRLSTLLDVESLSRVINAYFDKLVSQVREYGGDVLKFAGDAFFAEWRLSKQSTDLAHLVLLATQCAASLVQNFSDYQVPADLYNLQDSNTGATLSLHCAVGCGRLVGLHVGDFKGNVDDKPVERRREFLVLGEPIDQVSNALDMADKGEVYASVQAISSLASKCQIPMEIKMAQGPMCIATRDRTMFSLESLLPTDNTTTTTTSMYQEKDLNGTFRRRCSRLSPPALLRICKQIALYVHPVVRDEKMISEESTTTTTRREIESQFEAEAELRSVYTIFISAKISPKILHTQQDQALYQTLGDIMAITSRELDRYSGHLRQFIVDDKGVVLIATFGLRGSKFPQMVANNGLPATLSIHKAFKSELNLDSRIGATFGKVYCGVVGGIRRHEFAVMGAPVNLAARLMASKMNKGILVDEAVQEQVGSRFSFRSLPRVRAKGYKNTVVVFEPQDAFVDDKKASVKIPYVGRQQERQKLQSLSKTIIFKTRPSSLVIVQGESGIGKTAFCKRVVNDIYVQCSEAGQEMLATRSLCTATEQRMPLSTFRRIFLSVMAKVFEDHSVGTVSKRFSESFSQIATDNFSPRASSGSRQNSLARPLAPNATATKAGGRLSIEQQSPWSIATRTSSMTEKVIPTAYFRNALPGASLDDSEEDSRNNRRKRFARELSIQRGVGTLEESLTTFARGSQSSFSEIARLQSNRADSINSSGIFSSSESLAESSKSNATMDTATRLGSSASTIMRSSMGVQPSRFNFPILERLLWICDRIGYCRDYANFCASQVFGIKEAKATPEMEGQNPYNENLLDFLVNAFLFVSNSADLTLLFLDEFQWVDSLSWELLCRIQRKKENLMLLCAVPNHEKQVNHRLSKFKNAINSKAIVDIVLAPLNLFEIQEMLANLFCTPVDSVDQLLCADIYHSTVGLPVHLVELLGSMKRKSSVFVDFDGTLRWTPEAAEEQKGSVSRFASGEILEELFLSRLDHLGGIVRKVLQSCAVLGMSFCFSDALQLYPDLDEEEVDHALNVAVEEIILVELVEGDMEDKSLGESLTPMELAEDNVDRYFEFSHSMWREKLLKTMLTGHKVALHERIAQELEKEEAATSDQNELYRLLMKFQYWKECGNFPKCAEIALTAGPRMDSDESLELYREGLMMIYDQKLLDEAMETGEDIEDFRPPETTESVYWSLRLRIRIGLCHHHLGNEFKNVAILEDVYMTLKSYRDMPEEASDLIMPVIATICKIRVEDEVGLEETDREEFRSQQLVLLEYFICDARELNQPVHIGRALSMASLHFGKVGDFARALETKSKLLELYNFELSSEMKAMYGYDFPMLCVSESVLWLYATGQNEAALKQVQVIKEKVVALQDQHDVNMIIDIAVTLIHVLKVLGRTREAARIFKECIVGIRQKQDSSDLSLLTTFFHPVESLLDLLAMLEHGKPLDSKAVSEMVEEVLLEEADYHGMKYKSKMCLWNGELCLRLAGQKQSQDPCHQALINKGVEHLMALLEDDQSDALSRMSAEALLKDVPVTSEKGS